MLRTKSRVSSRSYTSSSLKRGTKKVIDDSSTTSDEVIFKGNMSRRAFRSDTAQSTHSLQPMHQDQAAQASQPAQNTLSSIIAAVDPVAAIAQASESDQPTEWKYRGRSGSGVASHEPMSAPTGLVAQQNEGFQRFYKAVVSPTHVRVTAGGRIVPNTRNPVSPTTKRTKDDDTVTNGNQSEPAPVSAPKQSVPVMGMPHPMPFFYPGFPGMPPLHPMSGMPMPMMPPGFPYPVPMPSTAPATSNQETAHKENQVKHTGENGSKNGPETESIKTNVKLSPPEQFDHSKPFMYNGQQWMFPMFPTPYPGFMGMPPPGYPGPHAHASPMMMPPHMAITPMMGPVGMMGSQPHTGTVPAAAPVATTRHSTPQPPSKPPISSIRPSQITRKQIDGLRTNLKYHEDQLHYNKHQIDEKDMENKIEMLLADIERFERVFKAQIEYEEKHYPKNEKVKEDTSSSGGRSSALSTKTSQSQSEESKESKATTMTIAAQLKLRKKERSRDSIGLNSNKSSTASYNCDDAAQGRLIGAMNPGRKSTLPSGAALAPVFQPRSVSALTVPAVNGRSHDWQGSNADEDVTQEQLEAAEKRLMVAGAKAWNLSQKVQGLANPPSQSHSPHGNDNLGVPYLVGTLPHGASPYPNHRIEYEYSRKLTDQEVKARHLYWGKAPRSISQGLPKYDGKNFYPPSPVKNITPSASPSIRRSRVPIGVPEIDYGFTGANGREADPFRAVTPDGVLLKAEDCSSNSKAPSVKSSQSFNSQAEDHSAEFEKALAESESVETDTEGSHAKEASETRSADYHDARANGTGYVTIPCLSPLNNSPLLTSSTLSSKLWQSMLKRGLTSSDVLPSTVSSTTAHAFLPQFSGNAAASLNPSITVGISAASRGSPAKDMDINTNGTSTFMTKKNVDACPPATGERLSDTLLNMVGMKAPAWAN